METLIEFVISLAITILLGLSVKKLLEKIIPELKRPEGIETNNWNLLSEHFPGGKSIGFFERILILVSFSIDQSSIIAGWFAFKVAAKWETWKNIIKFPDTLDNIPPLVWYNARKRLGSWILTRFLTGTLLNILIGGAAAYVGSHSYEFVAFLKNNICR